MRKVILNIATSLDGYIARKSGEVDWLFTDQDYGFTKFFTTIDTAFMGRKTYEQVLTFGDWPYSGQTCYVFTRIPRPQDDPNVTFVHEEVTPFVQSLQQQSKKHIWLIGGFELIQEFFNHHLVDEIIISIHPIILGEGIPLFSTKGVPQSLQLETVENYDTGLVQLCYHVIH